MAWAIAIVTLLWRFPLAVVSGGVQTLWVIARGRRRPAAGLVRLAYAPMSPLGAALLACLVTLTPGTTTLELDLQRRELLLHLLDVGGAEAAILSIRRDFERPLLRLFGTVPPGGAA